MFKCQSCQKSAKKQYTLIVEKRTKEYHCYVVQSKGRFTKKQFVTENKAIIENPDYKVIKDWKTKGWEIAKELKLCGTCFEKKGKK